MSVGQKASEVEKIFVELQQQIIRGDLPPGISTGGIANCCAIWCKPYTGQISD